jgi:hypothetical protein
MATTFLRLCMLVGLLSGGTAFAQPARGGPHQELVGQARDQEAPANRVRVEVEVVYANHSSQVDPRIDGAGLKRQLASLGFTGFELLSTQTMSLSVGQDDSFNHEGNRKVTVSLLSKSPETVKMRIQWTKDGNTQVDTTVSLPRGRAFVMGGTKYQDGKLVLVVTPKEGAQ